MSVALFWAGILSLAYGGYIFYRAGRATSWPTVEGEIVAAEIEERFTADRPRPYWVAHVRYRYQLGNRWYESKQFAFDFEPFGDEGTAQDWQSSYLAGTKVPVHFDPDDPRNAVLETSYASTRMLPIAIGLGLFLASYLFKGVG